MMENTKNEKFLLPSPNFGKTENNPKYQRPHYLTPSGMTLLPREKQPPPMYGPRGATVPPKHMNEYQARQPLNNIVKPEPEVQRQYCEACDIELQSGEDKRRHIAQHEPCPVEGCKFRGHATVMDKHVMMLHSSGLFDKVKRLNTPEEIEAWRNERRKKFPTLANVILRQEAKDERMRRGERLEPNKNRFGRRDDRKRPNDKPIHDANKDIDVKQTASHEGQKNNQQKRRKKCKNRNRNQNKPIQPIVEKSEEDEEVGVPRFRGTSKWLDYEHSESPKTRQTTALGTLCIYASSSDEENVEETKEINLKQESQQPLKDDEKCISSDDAPDEAPVERVSKDPPPPVAANTPNVIPKEITATKESGGKTPALAKKKFQRKTGLNYSKLHQRRQHTMLEKLLEQDIRHERNVLLQCVRFVVDNKFFGIGNENPTTGQIIDK